MHPIALVAKNSHCHHSEYPPSSSPLYLSIIINNPSSVTGWQPCIHCYPSSTHHITKTEQSLKSNNFGQIEFYFSALPSFPSPPTLHNTINGQIINYCLCCKHPTSKTIFVARLLDKPQSTVFSLRPHLQ